MQESDILYETGDFYIVRESKGYVIYKSGVTHATRRGIVGLSLGLERAKSMARDIAERDEAKRNK